MKIKTFFLSTLLLFCFSNVQAGGPLWSITPLTPTTVTIPANGTATIQYKVTNNSNLQHTLQLIPVVGLTQVTTAGNCGAVFALDAKQSCTLTLQINGSQLPGDLVGGPRICQAGSTLQCYQPSSQNILNIQVLKTSDYTVGFNVSGLVGSVTLQNNGTDQLTTSTDGNFVFSTPIAEGSTYEVTVLTQPDTQTCTVSNGSGTMGSANVTNVTVTCSTNTYTVGGSVSGLSGTVILQNNNGNSTPISIDGTFTFSTPVAEGSIYEVTVLTQPDTQTCTVSNGLGTMGSSNVTNVIVTCSTNTYTVGGSVSGLSGTVTLQNNSSNSTPISTNGPFTFSTPVAEGSSYAVTVLTQPENQTCMVSNGSGTMGSSNVTNVSVICAANTTTISVDATGVIPVGSGSLSLLVTNTGSVTASNIHAVLPGGWTSVMQHANNCSSLAASESCHLSFSSTSPYVAQGGIVITGDNIASPPSTALSFSINDYLVFEVTSPSVAKVIGTSDFTNVYWDSLTPCDNPFTHCTITHGQSLTDGAYLNSTGNTYDIITTIGAQNSAPHGTNAGGSCYNITSDNTGTVPSGTWYLPAVCEMGPSGQGADCGSGIANIISNLYALGFGGFSSNGYYWASTEIDSNLVWLQVFDNSGSQYQSGKYAGERVRCIRSITY